MIPAPITTPLAEGIDRERTNPIYNGNKLKLGTFGTNGKGTANTLVPEQYRPTWANVVKAAQLTDGVGMEAIVSYAHWKGHEIGKPDHPSAVVLDPYTWAAGLAQATKYSAIFVTTHAPVIHPITAAKQSATIDLISGGRFGLNVVAGWNRPELEMFGAPLKEHEERYKHLDEWLNVLKRLWTENDEFDFDGAFFKIVHGSSRPQPVQKPNPPIMSAGGSDVGRQFAAKHGDMCFIQASDDPKAWAGQVASYKDLAREQYNRETQVWMLGAVVQRETRAEAEAYLKRYAVDLADLDSVDASNRLRMENAKIRPDLIEGMRFRKAAGAGGSILVGTADDVASQLEAFSEAGIDGILLSWVDFADGLTRFQEEVLPRLERAGLRKPFGGLQKATAA
jgi:dimethylsulfone monooxygenase